MYVTHKYLHYVFSKDGKLYMVENDDVVQVEEKEKSALEGLYHYEKK